MKRKLLVSLTLATALVLASYPPTGAIGATIAPLVPGGSVNPVPLDTGFPSSTLASTILSGNFVSSTPGDFGGTYYTAVFREPGGTLTFAYEFRQTSGPISINTALVSSFDGFSTSVGYTNAKWFDSLFPTVAPTIANRSVSGDAIEFEFTPGAMLPPPTKDSFMFYIVTNATAFGPGSLSFLSSIDGDLVTFDGGSFATVAAFAPFAPVPIPPSALLLGSGLLAMGLRSFRRKKKV